MYLLRKKMKLISVLILSLFLAATLVGCGAKDEGIEAQVRTIELAIASCCVTEDVTTKELIPAFERQWEEKTGEKVRILPTFAGSGSLTNNIVGGNEVQVAILSSELYGYQLQERGLTTTNWRDYPNNGVVMKSVMVFVVREGNPKNITSFADLAQPGIEILHASPDTSGGAQWAIYAMYGSALKESEVKTGVKDEDKAFEMLQAIQNNVIAMPESAKQASAQFDAGQGDVLITYENEALLELEKGKNYEIIVPTSTVETGWNVIKIDKNIKPDQEEIVEEFIKFLYSDEAQRAYADYGYRSINDDITAEYDKYAKVELPFDLDYFGGVQKARAEIIDTLWKGTQQR
ncbi:MAG: sulfate ABC transporter substrate-binding protein [Bacillota bacterium]|nr:sulfate ABC transporter substrate-binding protein [Bacillota bacterium]